MPDSHLRLRFESGEWRILDLRPYLSEGRLAMLADPVFLAQVRVAFGTVEWPGEIDLDPEELYEYSVPE